MIENGLWIGASTIQESGFVLTLPAGIVEEKGLGLRTVPPRK